jgi:hypothetical protein
MPPEPPPATAGRVRCYGLRRVNPFRGVYHVIETAAGRAISANGVVWDIEVIAEKPAAWGSLNVRASGQAYIRYGLWSVDEGLVNRPLSPRLSSELDSDPLSKQCHEVIEEIEANIGHLPFELIDDRELWLFDSDRVTPIVLLASIASHQKPPSPQPRYWSASVGTQGVPSQHRFEQCSELEQQVRERAGFNTTRLWVQRDRLGGGQIEATGVHLDAVDFPRFLINQHWQDPALAQRVEYYIDWIAPSLLTLQGLSDGERHRLEQALHIQAISVEHHWHLYPRVVDEKYLKSARIQSRLQQAG